MLQLDAGEIAALAALEADIRSDRRALLVRKASLADLVGALAEVVDREVRQVAWEQLMLTRVDATTALSLGGDHSQNRVVLLLELQRRLTFGD